MERVSVALRWGDQLLDVVHLAARQRVEIEGLAITTDSSGSARVELPHGAELTAPGESRAPCAEPVELEVGARATIAWSGLTFELGPAAPEGALSRRELDFAEIQFFKLTSFGVLVLLALAAAFHLTPGAEDDGSVLAIGPSASLGDLLRDVPRLKVPRLLLPEQPAVRKQERQADERGPRGAGGPGRKRTRLGLLGVLDQLGAKADAVIGAGLGRGIDAALEGLTGGPMLSDALGLYGIDARGSTPGWGGGPLGLGRLPGLGGPERGPGGGLAPNALRKREETPPRGPTRVIGGLPREVISRVVRRHQSEIKFCYESELARLPDLAGKVAVRFVIDPAGEVSEAQVAESSLANANVEACMLESVRRWRFPEPEGGGVVEVSFRWVFKAAGDAE
ncbi:MAG: TonB family protein [Myxococcales bacterium]|nr:TonB family protein [Myxococcales bacterium]